MNEQAAQFQLGVLHFLTVIEQHARTARESIVNGQMAMQAAMQPKIAVANDAVLARINGAADLAARSGKTLHVATSNDGQQQAMKVAQQQNQMVQNCIASIIGNAAALGNHVSGQKPPDEPQEAQPE